MFYIEGLTIQKVIVNILDPSLSVPIISMQEMPQTQDSSDFFANHIIRTLNDEGIKKCQFDDNYNLFLANLMGYINKDSSSFATFAQQVSEQLFSIMSMNQSILPGDLAVIDFYYNGSRYLALLKMKYQNTYIHYSDFENEQNINSIIQHRTTLPGMGQRIGEAVIIKLDSMEVLVLERPVDIEGVRENYLSKRFLKCKTNLSSKQQYEIVKKATDTITKKYFDEDIEKKMEIKQELFNQLGETGEINLKKFADEVFETQMEIKEEFLEAIEKRGLPEPTIKLSEKTIEKSFEKQRIRTDSGIEIKIPMEMYNDPKFMEIIINPDGKVSITLKNINKVFE